MFLGCFARFCWCFVGLCLLLCVELWHNVRVLCGYMSAMCNVAKCALDVYYFWTKE